MGQQDVYFDCVTATNRGAFAPGEEVNVLGHSLVPGAPISTIVDSKLAPDGTPVVIPEAVVTASFTNNLTEIMPIGFAIENADRTAGIRVVQSGGYATSPGEKVSIIGFTGTVSGERVILASDVTSVSIYNEIPAPLAMNQKWTGSGTFGGQPNVWNPYWAIETFSYPDGALVGNNLWTGNAAANKIGVVGGVLRIQGAPGAVQADHAAATAAGADSFEMTVKIKRGVGTANIWQLFAYDPVGAELVRWYGSGTSARPRIGGQVLPSIVLTDDEWHTLGIKYTFATNTAEFFFDGESKGTITGLTGNDILGSVQFFRYDQPTLTDNYVLFDDLKVDGFTLSTPAAGLSNIDLLVRIFGRITEMNITGDLDGWFRVEDGSNVNQTSASAIQCRVPEWDTIMPFVTVGDYVEVTGVLGVRNGLRFLWTTDYSKY
ncbi:MAG: OB-fold nucleic acid binding domain-containing protein [Armatimonadota bacterium]